MNHLGIILISVFGFVCFLVLGLFANKAVAVPQERIMRALGRVELNTTEVEDKSLKDRIFRPLLQLTAKRLVKLTPKNQSDRTAAKLSAAGLSGQWESIEWKGIQIGFGILLSLLLLGLFTLMGAGFFWRLEMGLVGFLIGYLFPDSYLKAKAKERQREIENRLPDVLDLLTVSVEAGLGFDSALLKVVEKQKGVLAEEFLRVLQEIKMGRPRRESLRDLARRNPIEDLSNVVASLVQADQLGISIGGVLRNQAKQIRQRHRQRAEEKAQKAPIKMMIPLVFFVFPSIFIVVLGPAVIQILEMLK